MSDQLPLSIVIPCKEDRRVLACCDSVDVACDILVVINGSSDAFVAEMQAELAARRVRVECLAKANLSAALEHGVRNARHEAILLMDADCRFAPGSITALTDAMKRGDPLTAVFKGRVEFEPGNNNFSRWIARSRQVHTGAPVTAFKPPLLLDRRLALRIGGYFFNERLLWKEDADLDWRLRQAGITVVAEPRGMIHHAALDLAGDLRSNYRYGIGAALGEIMNIPMTQPDRSLRLTLKQQGVGATAYMALANLARWIGYRRTIGRQQ